MASRQGKLASPPLGKSFLPAFQSRRMCDGRSLDTKEPGGSREGRSTCGRPLPSYVRSARGAEMKKYEFSLVLKGPLELTEEIADRLFECGCDDGTPGTCHGLFAVDFHREAESLEAAINS